MEELHIGERIKERAKELRMGATELGNLINTSKQNVYGIYKRRTIDTGLLKKISEALDRDFFELYTDEGSEDGAPEGTNVSMLYEDLQVMRKEIDKLRGKGNEDLEGATISTLYEDIQLMRNEINELKVKYKSLEKGNG
ncbi:MAG: helix-turn-helix transcriptional regulator [Flavobacteriales bacterium]|nr:helix-turn-helix transcriptional regulator [Flavobacteriales bacterium]